MIQSNNRYKTPHKVGLGFIRLNRFIPFKGYIAINLFGKIYMRQKVYNQYKWSKIHFAEWLRVVLNHELIHSAQMQDEGYFKFYWKYLVEYLKGLYNYREHSAAYHSISFEIEAFRNESDLHYLEHRERFAHRKILKEYGE